MHGAEFPGTQRYRIERKIGAGGFGVVYQVRDRERGVSVALKMLRRFDGDALYRFKREWRSLAGVSHPNLVPLHELFVEDKLSFFTMELIEGCDFLSYVVPGHNGQDQASATLDVADASDIATVDTTMRLAPTASAKVDVDRLRRSLRQLHDGIGALHAIGKLHRDIKPSNVLVTEQGRVVLLDFGLVTEQRRDPHLSDAQIVGTAAYMAPEQALPQPVTEAADWYSVGVMLYEVLAGRLPHEGSALQVLLAKQSKDPPPPSQFWSSCPAGLEDLCMRLLARNPRQRAGAADLLALLGGNTGPVRLPSVAAEHKPQQSGRFAFVGRGEQLEALHRNVAATREGAARVVHLHGRSGIGKSALLRCFSGEQRGSGALVLEGRCYERESVPFKAIDGAVDALGRHLVDLPEEDAARLMPLEAWFLGRLFPVLSQIKAIGEAQAPSSKFPDRHELRRRAVAGLKRLLARVAAERAVLLQIDDLQWGDADSVALLEELLSPPDPPALLLLLCYRREERESSETLRALLASASVGEAAEHAEFVALEPLSASETEALAQQLLRDSSAGELALTIANESGGSPLFVDELVRHHASLSHTRDQRAGANGGAAERAAADAAAAAASTAPTLAAAAQTANDAASARASERDTVAHAVTLESLIRARLERLPDDVRRLLAMLSICGQPVDDRIVGRAAGVTGDALHAIDVLRNDRLIRTTGDGRVEPYHDRIRETLAAQLPAEDARELHARLARTLEGVIPQDPEALMFHWQQAGDDERAGGYAEQAAERASDALAFDQAARFYAAALELREHERARRGELHERLGDSLGNTGRCAEAAEAYLRAADDADGLRALELRRQAASQQMFSGRLDDGLETLELLLPELGLKLPRSPSGALLSFVANRIMLRLRGLGFTERDDVSPEDLLRIDACADASIVLGLSDVAYAVAFHGRHLALALRAGDPARVARALAGEAAVRALPGGARSRASAQPILDRARALARRVDDPDAEAFVYGAAGIIAAVSGRWTEGLEQFKRADELYRTRCTGARWNIDTVQYFWINLLSIRGEIAEATRRFFEQLKEADELGDIYASTSLRAWSYPMWIAADDTERGRAEVQRAIDEWPASGFHVQHFGAVLSQSMFDLYDGDGATSFRRIVDAWPELKRSQLLRQQLLRLTALSMRASSAVAAAARASGAEREAMLRDIDKTTKRIVREKMGWARPLATLARAGAANLRGDKRGAIALLADAEANFEASDMALYAACARRCRGEQVGGADGAALVESTDAYMQREGVRAPEKVTAHLAAGFY